MYQALYRKYRPSTFDDVYGQDIVTKILKNSIQKDKISHAYLFSGPRGTGKTSIAKIFAKTINCQNLNGFLPCDHCISCLQFNQKQDNDIIEIDAASNNGVDEIRELKSKCNLVPAVSKYKVYIIDEVHMLTTGAFNALLKTLEEPPKHIIFILATTELHKIPATILSRCQILDFHKINEIKISERLSYICKNEHISIEQKAIDEIARLSDGGMRDAISMLDQVIAYADNEITMKDVHEINGTLTQEDLVNFINALIQKNMDILLENINYYDQLGKNVIKLTEEILTFLKNVLLTKISTFSKNTLYDSIDSNVTKEYLIQCLEEMNKGLNEMKVSTNPRLILELTLIKIMNPVTSNNSLNEKPKCIVNEENRKTIVDNNSRQVEKKQIEVKKEITSIEQFVDKNIKQKKSFDNELFLSNNSELNKLQTIRIHNTLARFSKKNLIENRKMIQGAQQYVLEPELSQYATLLLDGEIKAASDENLIFVYDTALVANTFNMELLSIEKLVEKILKKSYHIIATDIDSWNIIREEFNNKKKIYEYVEENIDFSKMFSKKNVSKNSIESLFGDIIECEER